MVVRREATSLEYRKPRMVPGKKNLDQPLADPFLCQQGVSLRPRRGPGGGSRQPLRTDVNLEGVAMRVVVLWFAGEAPRGPARLGSIEPIRQLAVPGALAPLAALLRDPDGAIARGAAR